MSITTMTWVWDHSRAEGTELLVLLAMADFAGDNGWCFPRQETLAQRCRITVRTVQRAIDTLEGLGEIEVQRRARINWYKVIGDKLSSYDNDVALMDDKMSPLTRHARRVTHDTGVASKEPSVNRQRTTSADAPLRKATSHPDGDTKNLSRGALHIDNLDQLPERHVEPLDPRMARRIVAQLRQREVDS